MSFIEPEFAQGAYSIASSVVLLSIMLSGILIGIGKAFSSRRLYSFGTEELFQSIINGAIVGGAFTITTTLDSIAGSLTASSPIFSCAGSTLADICSCALSAVYSSLSSLLQSTLHTADIIGFASKLSFTFASISSTPFFSLEQTVSTFGSFQFSLIAIMLSLNLQLLAVQFISSYAMALLLPLGIVFRSFFATRKIGGALLGMAIGAYIFLPLCIYLSLAVEDDGWGAFTSLSSSVSSFREDFGALPTSNFEESDNLQEQVENLREEGFLDRVAELLSLYSSALSLLFLQNILMPLLGLLITAVAVFHLAKIFGGELFGGVGWEII
ncbi:hypothetical protein AUJ17_05560 [Candidatus Micrarchaeota archaeon CG1_02_47_40]|nr:MAG: hypothetical protein AUJ17_05560 [Candidatus Micrarchaeota archaeon CG1_02_47_40]